ncbi:HGGxSTG domain-containing protein [Altererythrobacter sp. GH1-8]|uniref:HGGxSTG domain-containing protein n=1 Tax=Altererythrobacter sp. GH1-8 TaxID=3349333 RepID=UPI00374D29FF
MNSEMKPVPKLLTNAKLCGAKTRAGGSCRCPAIKGRERCRLHGGRSLQGEAHGQFKHGGNTKDAIALRRAANRLTRKIKEQMNV